MSIENKKRSRGKTQQITRRQFLKEASLVVGGAAISSIALTSACSSTSNTTTSSTNTNTSANNTTTTSNIPTTTTTTSLPPAEGFVYVTPSEAPPKMEIPGCTTWTATDRMYIVEHMWIKLVAENIVVVGITEKMSELMDKVYILNLKEEGQSLTKDGYFGYAEAAKINVEFVSPVSGTVLQVNHDIWPDPELTVNNDPYVSGWMVTIELSNPEEIETLLTPQEYTDLNAKVS
ncbi:MAG: twin-arginine translocation signal domain-containing protein [Dehalococcoidia bacterium]|nr:MAG: twin-arginine translocation signal domain-containing protein [Dehalococcoidia bacterium]